MVAVAFVLLWSGYSGGLWGWCLLRGYDVTLGQLISPTHPYSGGWPPKPIPDTQIWPGGTSAGAPAGLTSPPIASNAALSNFTNSVLNQFRTHPPTPTGQPTTAQQFTGQG